MILYILFFFSFYSSKFHITQRSFFFIIETTQPLKGHTLKFQVYYEFQCGHILGLIGFGVCPVYKNY